MIGSFNEANVVFALVPKCETFRTADANTGYSMLYNGPQSGGTITGTLTNMATGYGFRLAQKDYNIDGSNDVINLSGSTLIFKNKTTFSTITRIKTTDLTTTRNIYQTLTDTSNRVALRIEGGLLYIFVTNGANAYGSVALSSVLTSGVYSDICVVYNGAGAANADRLKLYVNGVAVTLSFFGTIPATTTNAALPNLVLFNIHNGQAESAIVYSNALSASDALSIYNLGPNLGGLTGVDNGNGTMNLLGGFGHIHSVGMGIGVGVGVGIV